jgi:hypothetical protein
MKILSHRGYWKEPDERNSELAFRRSLRAGFGFETDIRDCAGRLLVSHDMPMGREMSLEQLLELFERHPLPLALNIKADGLAAAVRKALSAYDVSDWFVFDMSVPDMRSHLDAGCPVFARRSEVEKAPPWIDEIAGIWWDSFTGLDYEVDLIARFLDEGKRVCIVSPELHHRPYDTVWNEIGSLRDREGLMLCTDHPEQARRFFDTESQQRT